MVFNRFIKSLKNATTLVAIPRINISLFILLQIVAMVTYPGGTIKDKTADGYSFILNFFSDLGIYTAYNGENNFFSMGLFIIALTLGGVTFSIYYLALPQFFKDDKTNYSIALLGTIFALAGSISMIGAGFTPGDLYPDPHDLFANWIFRFYLVTAFCYTMVIFRSNILPNKYALGYGIFTLCIAMYIGVLEFSSSPQSSLSALIFHVVAQKMVVLTFCLAIVYQTFGFSSNKSLFNAK